MSTALLETDLELSGAIDSLTSGQDAPDVALNRIVVAVANHMQTDVGSLYLLQPEEDTLLLAATVGLLQSCVGNLWMQLDEGLVGLVAQQRSLVKLANAPQHERFKYFPEADEEEYQSFLGVPVSDREELLGVLVVQTIEPRSFTAVECVELVRVAELVGPLLS